MRSGLAGWIALGLSGLVYAGAMTDRLVYCAEGDPESFDSAQSDLAATHRAAAMPLYNRLVEYAPDGRLIPGLARQWEVSPDGKVWTFFLRQGVRFHRAPWFTPTRPFNADDVVWSLMRQIDPKHPGAAGATFPGALSGDWSSLISAVERVSDDQVRITLKRPYAPLLTLLASWPASIVSAEWGARLASRGELRRLGTEPIGTGPYQLIKAERGATIRYAAHSDYWAGTPAIPRLIYSLTPDPAVRVQKLRRGECDLAESLKPQEIRALEQTPNVVLKRWQPQITSFLAFNTQKKPFDDVRVRKALSLAIDRSAIVQAVFAGRAEPGWAPYSPRTLWGARMNLPIPSRDLRRASALLAEAGYPNGFETTIWARQGGGHANLNPRLSAELVQADWAAIGVRAKVVVMEGAEMGRRVRDGEHETAFSGWQNSLDPDEFYANLLTCKAARSSSARWCDPTLDALIDNARARTDIAIRTRLYEQAEARFLETQPWAVIAYPQATLAHARGLRGIDPSPAVPFQFARIRWAR
jgi:dipeptide transport system substrate-binding protein